MSTRVVQIICVFLLAVAPALGLTSAAIAAAQTGSAGRASFPADLCSLPIRTQLAGLHVPALCHGAPTESYGGFEVHGATWGTPARQLSVQALTGLTPAEFRKQIGSTGKPLSGIGSFARAAFGDTVGFIYSYVNGVGVDVVLKLPASPNNVSARAGLIAFTQALAKQL